MGYSALEASLELARRDAVMAELVDRHGPMRLPAAPKASERFANLARSIAFQQLNGRAAQTIWGRVEVLVDGDVSAGRILSVSPERLREAGLSGSKVVSLLDLAEHVDDGRLRLERIGRLADVEVVERLTDVRGIGPWTAQMFLMFTLRRPDIWPTGDYGVRSGFGRAFRNGSMPTPRELEVEGERFAPFRSVAAWYCWRAADDPGIG